MGKGGEKGNVGGIAPWLLGGYAPDYIARNCTAPV